MYVVPRLNGSGCARWAAERPGPVESFFWTDDFWVGIDAPTTSRRGSRYLSRYVFFMFFDDLEGCFRDWGVLDRMDDNSWDVVGGVGA